MGPAPPRLLICYQDREVPVAVPDPSSSMLLLYVSRSGDTFHTFEFCWSPSAASAQAVEVIFDFKFWSAQLFVLSEGHGPSAEYLSE